MLLGTKNRTFQHKVTNVWHSVINDLKLGELVEHTTVLYIEMHVYDAVQDQFDPFKEGIPSDLRTTVIPRQWDQFGLWTIV